MSQSAAAGRESAANELIAANFEADQIDQRAKDTMAGGSFRAEQIAKRAKSIIASQRAAAAAGGGDTTDATAQAFTEDTIRNASIDSLMEMANAESDAKKDVLQAAQTRATGIRMGDLRRNQARGQMLSDAGTIVNSASSWFEKYGG